VLSSFGGRSARGVSRHLRLRGDGARWNDRTELQRWSSQPGAPGPNVLVIALIGQGGWCRARRSRRRRVMPPIVGDRVVAAPRRTSGPRYAPDAAIRNGFAPVPSESCWRAGSSSHRAGRTVDLPGRDRYRRCPWSAPAPVWLIVAGAVSVLSIAFACCHRSAPPHQEGLMYLATPSASRSRGAQDDGHRVGQAEQAASRSRSRSRQRASRHARAHGRGRFHTVHSSTRSRCALRPTSVRRR